MTSIKEIKEGSVPHLRIDGRIHKVRVIDICADSASVETVKNNHFICQVSELKPIQTVSRAQERRLINQLWGRA